MKTITISRVKVRLVRDEGDVVAHASITFEDCFVVGGIRVVRRPAGFLVAMPSMRNQTQWFDVAHPLTTEMRAAIIEAVMGEYERKAAVAS